VLLAWSVGVLSTLTVEGMKHWSRRTRWLALTTIVLLAISLGTGIWAWNSHSRATREAALQHGRVGLTVTLMARGPGDNLWTPEIVAHPGEIVEYLLRIETTGPGRARNLIAGVNPPGDESYICASAQLRNSTNRDGATIYESSTPSPCAGQHLFEGGVNIGHYNPGAVAYVSWKARIVPISAIGTTDRTVGVARATARTHEIYNVAIVMVV
jgi:hypothetical protein